jgi:hypothetical protein
VAEVVERLRYDTWKEMGGFNDEGWRMGYEGSTGMAVKRKGSGEFKFDEAMGRRICWCMDGRG